MKLKKGFSETFLKGIFFYFCANHGSSTENEKQLSKTTVIRQLAFSSEEL